jgi:hypothetical protein
MKNLVSDRDLKEVLRLVIGKGVLSLIQTETPKLSLSREMKRNSGSTQQPG